MIFFDYIDGETEVDKAVVDMLLDAAMDLRNGVVRLCYNKDYVRHFLLTLSSISSPCAVNKYKLSLSLTGVYFSLYLLFYLIYRLGQLLLRRYIK